MIFFLTLLNYFFLIISSLTSKRKIQSLTTLHIVLLLHDYGKVFFFYRIKCNGIPVQQIRPISGRQLIGSGDHRHSQPMRFSLITNNPEEVRVHRNRLMQWPSVLRPGFSYFPRKFVKRRHYFVA